MNKLLATLAIALIFSTCALLLLPIGIDVTTVTLGTQNESDSASVLQIQEESKAGSARPLLSPNRVALLFPTVAPRIEEPVTAPVQAQPEIRVATWLKSLGTIKDERGIERLYFKDTRTGYILKFRSDGTGENGFRLTQTTSGSREILTPEGIYLLQGER